ncbi:MAG: GLUG motif-containing protein [Sideroxydans sp.]|nr:GLUG motif-containing protein [Sideroxydans sp.]
MFANYTKVMRSLVYIVVLLLSACGGGSGGSNSSGNGGGGGSTVSAPTFNGVAVAIPSAVGGDVTLAWDAATDDVTASSAMVYDISVATTAGAPFVASYTTAAGATSYTVTGLTAHVDYYFVVRARDEAGNRDSNSVEAVTHELMGVMNLRGAPLPVVSAVSGDVAFTYTDINCNTYTLDFGDGSSDVQNCPADGGDVTVNHLYAAAGTYTVTVTETPTGTTEYIKLTITPAAGVGVAFYQVTLGNSATRGGSWSGANPDVFTPNELGARVSVTDIESRLNAGKSVTIATSMAVGGNGDIAVNEALSWSANALTLNAERDIRINAVMTSSNESTLLLNSAISVYSGTVRVGMNAGGFSGRVDFPGNATCTTCLTINGNPYTVINDLGSEGSITTTDLQGMNGNLAGNYALGSDIDASATSGWNAGAGFQPVGHGGASAVFFSGNFNGLGHTISGLTINRPTENNVALFGYVSSLSIGNVGLVNVTVNGNMLVGSLVGYRHGGATVNSFSSGSVSGVSTVGGLIGENDASGQISNNYSTCSVSGTATAGGLIGSNFSSTVNDSHSTGNVTGGYRVGGLAGYSSGTIARSYSTGNVTSDGSSSDYGFGGLVGVNDFSINNSYSTGNVTGSVTGSSSVGGLVGGNGGPGISNSYSTGSVTGTISVGGLVGQMYGGISINSYWDTQTSGQLTSGTGTGLTTSQMKAQASFTGWDFASMWGIVEGVSYPTLKTF